MSKNKLYSISYSTPYTPADSLVFPADSASAAKEAFEKIVKNNSFLKVPLHDKANNHICVATSEIKIGKASLYKP